MCFVCFEIQLIRKGVRRFSKSEESRRVNIVELFGREAGQSFRGDDVVVFTR